MTETMPMYDHELPRMGATEFRGTFKVEEQRLENASILKTGDGEYLVAKSIARRCVETGKAVEDVEFRKTDYKLDASGNRLALKNPRQMDGVREWAIGILDLWSKKTKLSVKEQKELDNTNDENSESNAGVTALLVGGLDVWAEKFKGESGVTLTDRGDGFNIVDIAKGSYIFGKGEGTEKGYDCLWLENGNGFSGKEISTFLESSEVVCAQGWNGETWRNPDRGLDGGERGEEEFESFRDGVKSILMDRAEFENTFNPKKHAGQGSTSNEVAGYYGFTSSDGGDGLLKVTFPEGSTVSIVDTGDDADEVVVHLPSTGGTTGLPWYFWMSGVSEVEGTTKNWKNEKYED